MVKRIYNIMAVTRGTGPRCTCPDPLKCEHAPICDHAFPFRADGSAFAIHESMTASVGWLKSLEGMAAKIDERDCRWLSEHQDDILNILSKSPSGFPPLICEHAQTCEYKWRCRHARPFYEWTSSCQRVDLEEQPKSVVIASGEAGPSMYLTNEKYVSAKLGVISRYLGMLSYSEALFDHARMAILAIKRSVERIVEKKLTPPSIICGSASTCDLTENCPNAKPLYEWDASNCRRSRWDGRPLPKPVSCQGGV